MSFKPKAWLLFSALMLSLGVALFLQIYSQAAGFTILEHSPRPGLLFFIFWATAFSVIHVSWTLSSRRASRRLSPDSASPDRRALFVSLPLGLFLLTPWLLRFYFTRDDLRIRLQLFALFVVLAIVSLKLIVFGRLRILAMAEKAAAGFSSLSLRRRLAVLFLIALFIYQVAAYILVARGRTFTGDEPSYLMASHSLLHDGDINLANNYARRDYFSFYSKKDHPLLRLDPFGHYGRKGKEYIYPIHLPGISVLMLPFYWLSRFFSGRWLTFILKVSLSPWAALLGLQVYLYALERWGRGKLALGLWALYSFSSPVLFFAVHLYPEVPIALFSLAIFRKVRRPAALSKPQLVLLGFLLALFPWFGVKFLFLFGSIFFVSSYFLIRERADKSRILFFIALPLVSLALFFVFLYALYGTFSPLAVYRGVLTPAKTEAVKKAFLDVPLGARVESFLGYFLDQRDGLLLYAPFYFFSFLGLVELCRRKRDEFWCLLAIALPYLLNHAFILERPGACPQARVLTSLSWIAAIALGYFLVYNRKKLWSLLFGLACPAGFIISGLLLSHPSFLYQPTTSEFTSRPGDLFIFLSSLHVYLPPFLPSFVKIDNSRYWPNTIWVLALAVFIIVYARSRKEKALPRSVPAILASLILAGCFYLWVLFPRPALFPAKTVRYSPQKALRFSLFPLGDKVMAKEGGDFYLHREGRSRFLFASRTALKRVKLRFGSEKGEYSLKASLFDLPLYDGRTAFEVGVVNFEPAAFYRFKNVFIYAIDLTLSHQSPELMLTQPFLFQVMPGKE